jgi:hypothetical protein
MSTHLPGQPVTFPRRSRTRPPIPLFSPATLLSPTNPRSPA